MSMKQSLETLLAKSNKHFSFVEGSISPQTLIVCLYNLPASEEPIGDLKLMNNRMLLSIEPVKQKYSVKQICGRNIATLRGKTADKETIAKYIAEWFQKI
jgi:hypothetical protein